MATTVENDSTTLPSENDAPKAPKNGINYQGRSKHHHAKIGKSLEYPMFHSGESPTATNGADANMKKFMKNSRRSRSRFGRGLAKKGGGGGKGTWGKICEEFEADGVLDANDPNYDSDSMENCKIEEITPPLEKDEVEDCVKPIILEYFENGYTYEALNLLDEFNFGDNIHLIVVVAISLAMERKSSHREMVSVLISDLYGPFFEPNEIETGFDVLLEMLPDLMLDTPNADVMLGNFIARAVADDCVPPIYLQRSKEKYTKKPAKSAVDHANNLLATTHGYINVDQVWGITGGMRPVKYLIKQMNLILDEYITSNVKKDAGSCLTDLEVPHFHHEFVYEAITKAIEDSKDSTIDKICSLLQYLYDCGILTIDQLKNGFLRVFEEMSDIVIDVPFAYDILDKIKEKSAKLGYFPRELEKVALRGRKRFVSEGDGGLFKT